MAAWRTGAIYRARTDQLAQLLSITLMVPDQAL